MSDIQKMVNKFNKNQVKESAKEEIKVKYSTILNKLKRKFIKSKQNNASVSPFEDKQSLQEYKHQYEEFLKLSQDPEMENKIIAGEGKTKTHIVKGDFGYIVSTINDTSNKIACFHSHTYEGFADTYVDGVVQKVYANIRYEGFAGYTYGARGDFYSPEEHIYHGFIRTAKGEFKAVSCYRDKNLKGSVDPKTVFDIYINLHESYEKQCKNIDSVTKQ